jgi:hypothetical protein
MKTIALAFAASALAALLLVGPAARAATIDVAGVKAATGPAVCRVTVENAWGVPLAQASGFLLGDGRFAVTDLGAVARAGVNRATLHFQDGPTVTVREFGLAEPALGLVLLRLPADAPKRQGLPLATGLPALEGGAAVVVAGWQWGRQFEVVAGRLCRGPLIKEVASLARIDTPSGVDAFVRVEGGRMDGAAGSPVLDSSGTVLAVNLEVPVRNTIAVLAIPATSLWTALKAAVPQLKPLSELPNPLWPAKSLRGPGAPVTAQAFAGTIKKFKNALTCQRCGGRGRVASPDSGYDYGDYTMMPCPMCNGETVVFKDALPLLQRFVEDGTCTVWAPAMEERARAQVRAGAQDMLAILAGYGRRFQWDLSSAVSAAFEKGDGALPVGVALRARVLKAQDAPDGRYLFLSHMRSGTTLAVRADDLMLPAGRGAGFRREPAEGTWVFLAGTVLARCAAGDRKAFFILPMEWMPIPAPPGG